MAESSSDSEPEDYILYRDRDEWNDVVPVEQDDGPSSIVSIAYSEQFKDVYDYFRAILRTGEKSRRVLALTFDAIRMNPANYTVWHYRRLVLKELDADLNAELDYITKTIKSHPKNYQVWYHRQVIVKWLADPSQELQFTAFILSKDSKNYHAWQHRQWVIQHFSLWEGELAYVDKLIQDDIRNNSAWNQRYFVVANTTEFSTEVISQEIKYTIGVISKAKNNESPWNYLRGVVSFNSYADNPSVLEYCNSLYESKCRSPHLLSMLVDICEESLKLNQSSDQINLDKALKYCAELAMEYDTIRCAYWTFVGDNLEAKYRSAS
ncbi:Fnta [Bugula neritina]|uniref:Protein farnesyltransferase/geranylgeranyltransferase type-1 subunit alpha n=1 Tax=Bugula neritina TaxID=10212 RepID=A0A7J7J4M5_BUGNE|nr:Fnta [Bugula neritina]